MMDSKMLPLEKNLANLLAFGEEEFSMLPTKNKVVDEKKTVQS
jgi:hypothetical protein